MDSGQGAASDHWLEEVLAFPLRKSSIRAAGLAQGRTGRGQGSEQAGVDFACAHVERLDDVFDVEVAPAALEVLDD